MKVDSSKSKMFSYRFKIIDKETKETFIGAQIIVKNKSDSILNKGFTNYDGELVLKVEELANKIKISYIGYDDIIIQQRFGYDNQILVEWKSDWLRKIGKSTEKYYLIEKKRNIVKIENSKQDTINLIRKRLIDRLDNDRITRGKFLKKINK